MDGHPGFSRNSPRALARCNKASHLRAGFIFRPVATPLPRGRWPPRKCDESLMGDAAMSETIVICPGCQTRHEATRVPTEDQVLQCPRCGRRIGLGSQEAITPGAGSPHQWRRLLILQFTVAVLACGGLSGGLFALFRDRGRLSGREPPPRTPRVVEVTAPTIA